jgi:N-acyl homoserine lactone hydrolase
MLEIGSIITLRLGYVNIPEDNPVHPGQRWMVIAYLVRHPRGLFLFDTGIGEHEVVEGRYRPVRWPLDRVLATAGASTGDIAAVANCHLHFDHAGGNPRFPYRPIFAQRTEHELAGREGHTIPGLTDFPGAAYELLDGEAEPWEGLRIMPTPGHTPGHQSLVVETRQGRVVLAGQAVDLASDFAAARFEQELRAVGHEPEASYPEWLDGLMALDPLEVRFAHDTARWDRLPVDVPG